MVTAALCPSAEDQQFCVVFLEDYFEKFGDKAPNREETHLLIMQKSDVYEQYTRVFKNSVPPRPVVSYSRFIAIWSTIFPRCINRPWCDIPGKCVTCYEIDTQRRTADCALVLEHLKMAHHLHRGGMFMLERIE